MKRYINIYIVLLLAVMAVSCVNDHDIDTSKRDPMEVRLWADVGYSPNVEYGPRSATRGGANSTSGIIDPATDSIITMGMARIDEMYSDSYPGFLNCGEPIMAEMGLPNPANSYIRDITFTSSAQFFYNTTDFVKYVAWQPWCPDQEGYEYNTNGSATTVRMPITGDSDIMYGNVPEKIKPVLPQVYSKFVNTLAKNIFIPPNL